LSAVVHDAKITLSCFIVPAGKNLFPGILGHGPLTGLTVGTTSRQDVPGDESQHGDLVGLGAGTASMGVAGAPGVIGESKDLISNFNNGPSPSRTRPRQLLPRPLHAGEPSPPTEAKSNENGSVRIPRPPGQGRGRNQLLPRYWPRITDQELQQISSGEYPFNIFRNFQ
jgi:hypothetical protein